MKSTVNRFVPGGYPGKMLYGNIEKWTLSVLETNPGIIDQIKEGPYGNYIKRYINDSPKYLQETRQRIAVEKFHGAEGGRSLMITTFKPDTCSPLAYDIGAMKDGEKNFTGCKEVKFYVDGRNFGDEGCFMGIGFKDGDRVLFQKPGETFYLEEKGGNKKSRR